MGLTAVIGILAAHVGLVRTGMEVADKIKKEKKEARKKAEYRKWEKHRQKSLDTYGFHLDLG